MRLYEIHANIGALFDAVELAETPEALEALQAKIDAATQSWDEKLIACCCYYKNLLSELDAFDTEIERLTMKRDVLNKRVESFKAYMANHAPKTKWSNGVHTIGWRESASVKIEDEAAVPIQYKREVWKLEVARSEAKKDLECGAVIPGLSLEKKQNIQIK